MQQRAPLVVAAGVVGPEEGQQVTFGLVGNHLDEVGQVFTFRGQLDHGAGTEVADFHPWRDAAAPGEQLGEALPGRPGVACRVGRGRS